MIGSHDFDFLSFPFDHFHNDDFAIIVNIVRHGAVGKNENSPRLLVGILFFVKKFTLTIAGNNVIYLWKDLNPSDDPKTLPFHFDICCCYWDRKSLIHYNKKIKCRYIDGVLLRFCETSS